jgi:hypothetical protein
MKLLSKLFSEKISKPGKTILFERMVEIKIESWQDIMFSYGKEIAKEHKIKAKEHLQLKGW